jgi:hypothetical protein
METPKPPRRYLAAQGSSLDDWYAPSYYVSQGGWLPTCTYGTNIWKQL